MFCVFVCFVLFVAVVVVFLLIYFWGFGLGFGRLAGPHINLTLPVFLNCFCLACLFVFLGGEVGSVLVVGPPLSWRSVSTIRLAERGGHVLHGDCSASARFCSCRLREVPVAVGTPVSSMLQSHGVSLWKRWAAHGPFHPAVSFPLECICRCVCVYLWGNSCAWFDQPFKFGPVLARFILFVFYIYIYISLSLSFFCFLSFFVLSLSLSISLFFFVHVLLFSDFIFLLFCWFPVFLSFFSFPLRCWLT